MIKVIYTDREEKISDIEQVSDGYHTFAELYEYRKLYNAAFFNELAKKGIYNVHKSKDMQLEKNVLVVVGLFIVMADLPTGQISNHYELKDWDLFKCTEKSFSDIWDGHSPQEAAKRLLEYLGSK